jgi:hypothetical protein
VEDGPGEYTSVPEAVVVVHEDVVSLPGGLLVVPEVGALEYPVGYAVPEVSLVPVGYRLVGFAAFPDEDTVG